MADLLLVDNDERINELVAWFLRRRGHGVRCAASYREAREELVRVRPDLVLADLELGDERGEVELARLAGEELLPPTLVVSGYLDHEVERALHGIPGVVGTLSKPFDLATLEARVEAALVRRPEGLAPGEEPRAPDPAGARGGGGPPGGPQAHVPEGVRGEEGPHGEGWIEIRAGS